eukprot:scaffold800_cov197-Alexandrium_tamarense.AAC.6
MSPSLLPTHDNQRGKTDKSTQHSTPTTTQATMAQLRGTHRSRRTVQQAEGCGPVCVAGARTRFSNVLVGGVVKWQIRRCNSQTENSDQDDEIIVTKAIKSDDDVNYDDEIAAGDSTGAAAAARSGGSVQATLKGQTSPPPTVATTNNGVIVKSASSNDNAKEKTASKTASMTNNGTKGEEADVAKEADTAEGSIKEQTTGEESLDDESTQTNQGGELGVEDTTTTDTAKKQTKEQSLQQDLQTIEEEFNRVEEEMEEAVVEGVDEEIEELEECGIIHSQTPFTHESSTVILIYVTTINTC